MDVKLSGKLVELRKEKRISQEYLADKMYVSRQAVSKWETGETTPDLQNSVKLAEFFEVSLDTLVLDRKETSIEKEHTATVWDFLSNGYNLTIVGIVLYSIVAAIVG